MSENHSRFWDMIAAGTWHSIDECLPPTNTLLLLLTKNGDFLLARREFEMNADGGCWRWRDSDGYTACDDETPEYWAHVFMPAQERAATGGDES